jgi:GxxExxY protein
MAQSSKSKARDDPLTYRIIGCAILVHRELGPGLLEGVYEECLHTELISAGLTVERQPNIKVAYQGGLLHRNYRPDFVVERGVVVEVKSVSEILPVHRAQVLTYLKLSGYQRGLLINFNTAQLVKGVKRLVASRREIA